ncbi:uncharacterized protein LOC133193922 [Saccostrea echinata]|uniref:uncharacterized protein LOC133193922 n=1 Tax=Saccostrea echinata TaxID=191078 RepID=UPI002A80A15D|nr:uncharacterized protein LOC133193922 [Saccostrea echinata]
MNLNCVFIINGSHKEGFRIEESDVDWMIWSKHHRVFWTLSQAQDNNSSKQTQMLADCSESPPGFALLQLIKTKSCESILETIVKMNDKFYISSSLHKKKQCSEYGHAFKIHGPCVSGEIDHVEYDSAYCFACNFWPPSASSWTERCHFWPPSQTVNDIVKTGCHFVAIGSKQGNHEDIEWRISFSLAEHKLVFSMNHFQFLTYNLLKLFLREVINKTIEENKLLSSYHIKTAVFWAIQNNVFPRLRPKNFLKCFWMCFKVILKWVYEGYCPNFFIPENNMFHTKIFGATQNKLFVKLYSLYEKGVLLCILESPSIKSYTLFFPYIHNFSSGTKENALISRAELEREVFTKILAYNAVLIPNLTFCLRVLDSIEQLIGEPLKEIQVVQLQRATVSVLQNTPFILHSWFNSSDYFLLNLSCNTERKNNRQMYVIDKISMNMLKFTDKFGCITDMLYIVMYFYKTCRNTEASTCLKMIDVKIEKLHSRRNSNVDTNSAEEHSWSMNFRKLLPMSFRLSNKISYIMELMIEQHCSLQNNKPYLYISSFVLFLMLKFLNNKHVDIRRSQEALDYLQIITDQGQEFFIEKHTRDISWQILGICQQISGNPQAALYAYKQALKVDPCNDIQIATQKRILNVEACIRSGFYKKN